jgi:hypothetical protein
LPETGWSPFSYSEAYEKNSLATNHHLPDRSCCGALLLIEQPTSQTTTSAPQPTEGGAYAEALIGSLQRLNPVLDFYNSVDQDVDRLLYSRLITFDDHGNRWRTWLILGAFPKTGQFTISRSKKVLSGMTARPSPARMSYLPSI